MSKKKREKKKTKMVMGREYIEYVAAVYEQLTDRKLHGKWVEKQRVHEAEFGS